MALGWTCTFTTDELPVVLIRRTCSISRASVIFLVMNLRLSGLNEDLETFVVS
jgi:hypothetical protein